MTLPSKYQIAERHRCALKGIMLLILSIYTLGASGQSVEYFVKASFIQKFARYTEWPANSIGNNFVIGVAGTSPFSNELETLAAQTHIKGKPVKIVYLKNPSEVAKCQILFISNSERRNLTNWLTTCQNQTILLVADTPGFSQKGVHFNFYYNTDETIHFEINVKALAAAGLTADLQLLNIAKIIN